jgi:hypothetical protein
MAPAAMAEQKCTAFLELVAVSNVMNATPADRSQRPIENFSKTCRTAVTWLALSIVGELSLLPSECSFPNWYIVVVFPNL